MIRSTYAAVMGAILSTGLMMATAQAAPQSYEIEKPHTQIVFSVNHLGFSHSFGKFTDYSGTFVVDPDSVESSNVDVTINTASIDLDDQKWNDHLKNADFFNVEQFPTMTFKSTKVEKTGDKTANLTGDLTLLGVTKPVTLEVTLNGQGEHPFNKKQMIGFSAKGSLKRSDFGMGYGLPAVGDDITLMIEVEGIRQDAVAPVTSE